MNQMKNDLIYKENEWRLFIDSSKRSLKAVLLHNKNVYSSIPVAHSVNMKEEYFNIEFLLQKLKYNEHLWQICGDLKMTTILLGQQSGYTKYSCYLCLWNSRDKPNHYIKKNGHSAMSSKLGIIILYINGQLNQIKYCSHHCI